MLITQMIAALQALKDEHGDLPVLIERDGELEGTEEPFQTDCARVWTYKEKWHDIEAVILG